jgi:hypothetical protein
MDSFSAFQLSGVNPSTTGWVKRWFADEGQHVTRAGGRRDAAAVINMAPRFAA